MFPADSGVRPLYIVLSLNGKSGYNRAPKFLAAFPDTYPVKAKAHVQGGGRKRERWLDRKGRIYEWDYENGTVELYTKQGNHLGEFNAQTGEQTKPAKPGRTTPK